MRCPPNMLRSPRSEGRAEHFDCAGLDHQHGKGDKRQNEFDDSPIEAEQPPMRDKRLNDAMSSALNCLVLLILSGLGTS